MPEPNAKDALHAIWREAAEKRIEHGIDWPRVVLALFRDLDQLRAEYEGLPFTCAGCGLEGTSAVDHVLCPDCGTVTRVTPPAAPTIYCLPALGEPCGHCPGCTPPATETGADQ